MMMNMITLENEHLRLTICPLGAEMHSLITKADGREQLWHGDPAVWGDHAPWLFPLIGQLKGGRYLYQGQEYAMPMHGFASKAAFQVVQQSADSAVVELRSTPETLRMFPWRFVLELSYSLAGTSVRINAKVRCEDETDMYFSFGAHPGFVCQPGDELALEGAGTLWCHRLEAQTHLLKPQQTEMPDRFLLEESLFDDDALLFRAPACDAATLRRADGSGVRFAFGRTPWVGVWSKKRKGLNYVCIEPWFGVDDPIDASGDIETKLDIVHLKKGEAFSMPLCITPFQTTEKGE